ncbi:MAG: VOC family protein [Dehalococcoidales bacterium]|jgi:catechol 2,3-dioxygenase-like lactoylglutathione lyase family enzyme|nr:hypothetical protein [Dehalococcoidales bacterium]MDP6448556.1 VOC family protein [Dehalococcoidales bacterium]MDP6577157.1 VOC family protein [Dehalococcoidales bacterium]MDP6825277.1 VOC family protein [Dehalococcoidales bacterium]MDP7285721.1 VOC family protein [Dehalococcoidales bacterium]|tara:strand:+ start:683 stop:1126 length:444 start_codon:yes stop_codon:yes gene_type:complete
MANWKLHHIGVIVRDIDKAVGYYQSLGIAKIGREVEVPDERPPFKAKFVEIDSLPIEFIQLLEGESRSPSLQAFAEVCQEFLDKQGEGVQHFAFAVDNLEAEKAKMVGKGASVISEGKAPAASGSSTAHFDTRRIGNFTIQLIQGAE